MDDLYDSWEEIAQRQAAGRVEFRPELGAYEALDHDVIVRILKDPGSFSSRQTTMFTLAPSVANLDPPLHTPLRRTLLGAFSKGAVTDLVPAVAEYASELIDTLPAPGAVVDIKQHYAVPLALHTIMALMRIPARENAMLRAGTEALEHLASGLARTPEVTSAARTYDAFFGALAEARINAAETGVLTRDPRDPVASLVWAYLDGTIEREAVGRNIAVLFNGGNGTTATLITNAVFELEHAPEQRQKFLERPEELVAGFVEEALRFEGSTHGLFRTATVDTEVGDAILHDGDRVFCRFGAGSRDERAFPDPDRFDIERNWSQSPPHLAFGLGAHFCIGAPLARAEIAVALTTLYRRLPGLRLAPSDDDERLTGLIFRGWQRLHVTYSDRT